MFIGIGAARDLLRSQKIHHVFIDEIDASWVRARSWNWWWNDEREQTLNQLLTEMDGFKENKGVISRCN
jgi:cell division protease FtsH